MGFDCVNTLPLETKPKDVSKFLVSLGYKRADNDFLYFHSDDDYKYLTGVSAYITQESTGEVLVSTRTQIWRTWWDANFHNHTIRQLKDRFGGSFVSDYGKGRYLHYSGAKRTCAEAGCYLSYFNWENNITRATFFLSTIEGRLDMFPNAQTIPLLKEHHPLVLSVNLVLPLLVASLEEYFKSTFIALLKYSERKPALFRNSRVLSDDLVEISNGGMSVEEGVARTMSFQNISKISTAFRELDPKFDLSGLLKKPYRRRKESLYDTLDRVFEQRHALIHRNRLSVDYTLEQSRKDIKTIQVAVERVYSQIIDRHSWSPYDL